MGNGAIARKEPVAGLFLCRWCGCRHRASGLLHGRREEDAGARLSSAASVAAMIPVSLVVVVVGGWTAVYLTDLVLKVRASDPLPKPAVPCTGAHGPRPFLFYLPFPGVEAVRRVSTCGLSRGAGARGVHFGGPRAGGVW